METSHALLVTADGELVDDLLRLAAAAGVALDVAQDPGAARVGWSAASLVLVGADQLLAVSATRPTRRDGVHVVARRSAEELFPPALDIGAERVLELPAADTWLVELLTDVADGGARRALTIAVVGGSGGVGASTLAAALAITAASPAAPALLLDADPLGGGLDRFVGMEEVPGVRWEALLDGAGRLGSRSLREALPGRAGLAVLTWAGDHAVLDPDAVGEVLSAGQRGHDTVVLDLPRHLDRGAAELLARCDHTVLVVGLTVQAAAAARRAAARIRGAARRLHLLARTGGFSLDAGDVARALEIPLLGTVPHQRRLEEWVDLGLGPVRSGRGPLARSARETLRRLAAGR